MAQVDNIDNINFSSLFPIDKIVDQGAITIINDGDTTSQAGTYQSAKIVTDSIAHTYGRAGLLRARWSIDGGVSYQALETQIIYTFTFSLIPPAPPSSSTLSGLDSAISVGSDTDTIYFRTANGKHGDVTDDGTTILYTPTSRTFLIEYALYERE